MELFLDTPLSRAIFDLLRQLNNEIERHLQKHNTTGLVKAYIFGGCAVHMYTNTRGSNDLDIEFEAAKKLDIQQLVLEIEDVYFTDLEKGESQLILDDTFNIAITPVMCPDYKQRAIPLAVGNTALHTFLAHPLDIAISKLSRCQVDDIKDIIAIYQSRKFTLREFRQEAHQALNYTATPNSLSSNINHVILQLESINLAT